MRGSLSGLRHDAERHASSCLGLDGWSRLGPSDLHLTCSMPPRMHCDINLSLVGVRVRFLIVALTGRVTYRKAQLRPVWILFVDLPPGHGNDWTCARKTLTPTEAAFAKDLEVDARQWLYSLYVIREKTHS